MGLNLRTGEVQGVLKLDNDVQLLLASGLVVMIGILTIRVVTSVEPSAVTTRQRNNTNLADGTQRAWASTTGFESPPISAEL
jgi:hypothetical protein